MIEKLVGKILDKIKYGVLMVERELIYERVGNYTKYKLVEMLVEKHKGKFKNLNQIEELADEILQVLAISGLKHYNDLREGFNEDRD